MNTWQQALNTIIAEEFEIVRWDQYDYTKLSVIPADQARRKNKVRLNECFIMLDTETSKTHGDQYTINKIGKRVYDDNPNYIVKWSIAIAFAGINICVLWGDKPSECLKTVENVENAMRGNRVVIYVHNLAYDWVFMERFMIAAWGEPESMLNTKPHYPIVITFLNGVELRDSYILAQRSLESWGTEMQVEHGKAVNMWDYDKIRNQDGHITDEELMYICDDVLCGVECLNVLRKKLHKTHSGMPYTATGIVRNECRTIGKQYNAHKEYENQMADFEWYKMAEWCYHGGYTHANRHEINFIHNNVTCYDFASSYPYVMLSEKFPCEKFHKLGFEISVDDVINTDDCFILDIGFAHITINEYDTPMPILQVSKCTKLLNAVVDNGRILEAAYARIIITEVDLRLILEQYQIEQTRIFIAYRAKKDYLPKWFTDYIYNLFERKCKLKKTGGADYAISKARINACYGMSVQKVIQDDIVEDFETGEYMEFSKQTPEEYDKEVKKRGKFLPYHIGIYVTAYAMRNLFRLGKCVDEWLYTDTDSIYGTGWNLTKVDQYNNYCKKMLLARGYPGVLVGDREYWLGVAEHDGSYIEFKAIHSKCYAAVDTDGKLKITIAGVPKKTGSKCLMGGIINFTDKFVFDGETTGKTTHIYQYVDKWYTDENGNEVGNSINLVPCDYQINGIEKYDITQRKIEVQVYE